MERDDKTKGTAQPGSEPGTKPDDKGGATPQPAAGDKDKPPFDQDPRWKSAREAEKNLQSLQTALGVESVEELLELADLGSKLRDEGIDDKKIKGALEAQKEYDRVKAYWAEQEEKNRQQTETPDERERRLDEKERRIKDKEHEDKRRREHLEEGEKVAKSYDSEVTRLVSIDTSIPENERNFYAFFLGVNNPSSSINISSKEAIKGAYAEAIKVLKDFKDVILENAAKGKGAIPRVPGSAIPGDLPPPKIKNLAEARKTMTERLGNLFK
jgi:hypothetical protein